MALEIEEREIQQKYTELIALQKQLFIHQPSVCPHNKSSNFMHIPSSQWQKIIDKMCFYYQCEEDEIQFEDNARPFSCCYDEICRSRPYKYTGFVVQGWREGYGLLTYWNGVYKYKGVFTANEAESPGNFREWNSKEKQVGR